MTAERLVCIRRAIAALESLCSFMACLIWKAEKRTVMKAPSLEKDTRERLRALGYIQ